MQKGIRRLTCLLPREEPSNNARSQQESARKYRWTRVTHDPISKSPPATTPWQPGVLQRFPWGGLLALLASLTSIIASSVTLALSNERPQSEWSLSPSVVLAICSTVGVASLHYAKSEAATLSWWISALQGGTIADLHRQWAVSTGIWSTLRFWRHFSRNSLATLGVTLCFVVAPLLQRASSVDSRPFAHPTTVSLAAATTDANFNTAMPMGSGWSAEYAPVVFMASNDGRAIKNLSDGAEYLGCPGTLTHRRCNITTGLVEYPVTIANHSLSLRSPEPQTFPFYPFVNDTTFLRDTFFEEY
ncbi:hypothetical protein VTN96DRAFT_1515 [Rasamsonia emersonii]